MKSKTGISVITFLSALVWLCGSAPTTITESEILAYEDWRELHDRYQPRAGMVSAIDARMPEDLRVEVYFAFWCGDSRDNLPRFIRLMSLLEKPAPLVRYHRVERKPSPDTRYYVESKAVERIPTFIFFSGEKELGRIVEQPEGSLAEHFLHIIF